MTEMAPVGYVGVSPKCLLGFNKVYDYCMLMLTFLKGFSFCYPVSFSLYLVS